MIKTLKSKFSKTKLTYTREMKEEDLLWNEGKEDLNRMKKLHEEIVDEAVTKGFTGATLTYRASGTEIITEIYKSQKDLVYEVQHGKDKMLEVSASCKYLIELLEKFINEN